MWASRHAGARRRGRKGQARYPLIDSADTTVDTSQLLPRTTSGDTVTYHNFLATSSSDHTLPDIGVWLPYIWVRIADPQAPTNGPPTYETLTWHNALHGWYTGDFIASGGIDTHKSLLVTAEILTHPDGPDLRVAAGIVGTDPTTAYPRDSNNLKPPVPFPEEMIKARDLLPFADLGVFTPHQSKSFDLAFTSHWGGTDLGPQRIAGFVTTLEPNHPNGTYNLGVIHHMSVTS